MSSCSRLQQFFTHNYSLFVSLAVSLNCGGQQTGCVQCVSRYDWPVRASVPSLFQTTPILIPRSLHPHSQITPFSFPNHSHPHSQTTPSSFPPPHFHSCSILLQVQYIMSGHDLMVDTMFIAVYCYQASSSSHSTSTCTSKCIALLISWRPHSGKVI